MELEAPIEDPWSNGAIQLTTPLSHEPNNALPRSLDDASISPALRSHFLESPSSIDYVEDPLVRAILDDTNLPIVEKGKELQELFSRAASNGDLRCVQAILHGPARQLIDIDAADEDGITPLIHAACFCHAEVVRARTQAV